MNLTALLSWPYSKDIVKVNFNRLQNIIYLFNSVRISVFTPVVKKAMTWFNSKESGKIPEDDLKLLQETVTNANSAFFSMFGFVFQCVKFDVPIKRNYSTSKLLPTIAVK